MLRKNYYDVIVIGAGVGGLSTAAALANKGYNVLILELNAKIGGYCQNFKRKGFIFNASIHKIGPKHNKYLVDSYIKEITGHDEAIKWIKFKEFYRFGEKIINCCNENLLEQFVEIFPQNRREITTFFDDMERYYKIFSILTKNNYKLSCLSKEDEKFYLGLVTRDTKSVLDIYLSDKKLKSFIFALLDTSEDSISSIIPITFNILKGTGDMYIPEGGIGTVIDIMENVIVSNNGKILVDSEVEKIIVKENKVVGVIVNGEEIYSKYVVSSIDLTCTIKKLIGEDKVNQKIVDRVNRKWRISPSCFSLWLALDCSLDKLGLSGETITYFKNEDRIIDMKNELTECSVDVPKDVFIQISSTSSLDSNLVPNGKTQLVVGFIVSRFSEDSWGTDSNGLRTENYYKIKHKVEDIVLDILEEVIPNVKQHIIYKESATPITYERFSNNINGAYLGFKTSSTYTYDMLRINNRGLLPNLYQASAWSSIAGGFAYILNEGMNTVDLILKEEKRSDLYDFSKYVSI